MHKNHILEEISMQTIYINGVKATHDDLAMLFDRVRNGSECILDMHFTKNNNIAIVTA
jgi:hypothetical protein